VKFEDFPVELLDTQYRMHPELASYISEKIYEKKLKSGVTPADRPLPEGFSWPDPAIPIAFVNLQGTREISKNGS
jgi:regulator of nonsense transcripts 1